MYFAYKSFVREVICEDFLPIWILSVFQQCLSGAKPLSFSQDQSIKILFYGFCFWYYDSEVFAPAHAFSSRSLSLKFYIYSYDLL